MNPCKKYTAEGCSVLVTDTTPVTDNPLHFTMNVLERTQKLNITVKDKIKNEKPQNDINREAAEITPFLSGKIDKYDYLTGEEILLYARSRMIEQVKFKFNYSPLGKSKKI